MLVRRLVCQGGPAAVTTDVGVGGGTAMAALLSALVWQNLQCCQSYIGAAAAMRRESNGRRAATFFEEFRYRNFVGRHAGGENMEGQRLKEPLFEAAA